MVTKYNIDDRIKTKDFEGCVSMITITKKGVRYRAFGTRYYETYALDRCQKDIWEDEIKGENNNV